MIKCYATGAMNMKDKINEPQVLDLFQDARPISEYISNGLKKAKKTINQFSSSTNDLPETFIKVNLNQLQEHVFNEEVYPSQDDDVTVRQVMESILTNGFDGVITCTKGENDTYIIVSGHIRYRALMQLVKEGHSHFNEVMVYLKEFKSIQDEKMYILDMNNAKRKLNDIHQFRSIKIYLDIYRSNPDSDLSKRSEIQFLCDKLNLSERQVYKYLSLYREFKGDVEKAIEVINQYGSVNKTVQSFDNQKVNKKSKFIENIKMNKRGSSKDGKKESTISNDDVGVVGQLVLMNNLLREFNKVTLNFYNENLIVPNQNLIDDSPFVIKSFIYLVSVFNISVAQFKVLIDDNFSNSEKEESDKYIKDMVARYADYYKVQNK